MSFYANLLKSIGFKKTAQPMPYRVPAPASFETIPEPVTSPNIEPIPSVDPVSQPASGLPFGGKSQGNITKQEIDKQILKEEMKKWLRNNISYINNDEDLYHRLEMSRLEYWGDNPLFYEAKREVKNSFQLGVPSPQLVNNVDPNPDLSVDEIAYIANEAVIEYEKSGKISIPDQIKNNPNNMAIFQSELKKLTDPQSSNENMQSGIAGISAKELADTFEKNYITELYERLQTIGGEKNFANINIRSALVNRVFREVEGGYDSSGIQKQDFRIKFFIENHGWLDSARMLPPYVKEMVEGGRFSKRMGNKPHSMQNYKDLYEDIDDLSYSLKEILENNDPSVKNKVLNWVMGKIFSEGMVTDKKTLPTMTDSDGNQVDLSEEDFRQVENTKIAPSQEQREDIKNAYNGDLISIGKSLRHLGSEVRQYMLNDLAKRNPSYAKGGKNYAKTIAVEFWADQAASIIEDMVNSDLLNNPQKLEDLKKKGKLTVKKENDKIHIMPVKGENWSSVDISVGIPLADKLSLWIDKMIDDSSSVSDGSYLSELKNLDAIGTHIIDKTRMKTDPGYKEKMLKMFKNKKTVSHQTAQVLTNIGEYLTSDEVLKKYPKNVIFSYLSLLSTHSNIKQVGRLLSEKSQEGKDARRQLVLEKIEEKQKLEQMATFGESSSDDNERLMKMRRKYIRDQAKKKKIPSMKKMDIKEIDRTVNSLPYEQIFEMSKNFAKEEFKSLSGFVAKYNIDTAKKLTDEEIKIVASDVIAKEISDRSNISEEAAKYYAKILDRDDTVTANIIRKINIIKNAVSRIYNISKLASSMSKFASTDHISEMKKSIRNEMRQRLSQL